MSQLLSRQRYNRYIPSTAAQVPIIIVEASAERDTTDAGTSVGLEAVGGHISGFGDD